MAKRLFDIVVSSIALVLLAPAWLIIATAIRLDSPGPAIYQGVRTGRFGRNFRILKFRTMVQGADRIRDGNVGKNDPRITRVGAFLRSYKLDELPQFWNVLTGDMSLVGPRPELPNYTNDYSGDELIILTVRPGITDYASIVYSQLDVVLGDESPEHVYEEQVLPAKNSLRVEYVRRHSFVEDLRIIARTLRKMIGDKRPGQVHPASPLREEPQELPAGQVTGEPALCRDAAGRDDGS